MTSKIEVTYIPKTNKFHLACPISFELNTAVRSLPNRRYYKKKDLWVAPALSRNAEQITKLNDAGVINLGPGCAEVILNIKNNISMVNKQGFPKDYKFKIGSDPYSHQTTALHEAYDLDQFALYMEMGTGKSKVIIDTACAYFKAHTINALVILCQVSIRSNWVEQFEEHAPIDYDIIVCNPKTKKQEREIDKFIYHRDQTKLKVFIVGTESISRIDKRTKRPTGKAWDLVEKFMLCHNPMMVIDEAHQIKNHDKNRSRNAVSLGLLAKKRMIATGTEVSNSIMDLYMQFEFLNPDIIGIGDYYSFRNRYAVMGGFEGKQITGYDNIPELMDLIRPWVFQCTKKEALPDLPDKVYSLRKVQLTKEQKDIYVKIKKDRMADLPVLNPDGSNEKLVADNILVMHLALQQIVSGFVTYTQEGQKERRLVEIVKGVTNPKIKELLAILDEHKDKPVIIWSRFRKEIANIVEALETKYGIGCVAEYHGGVSSESRDINEKAFKTKEKRFFVSNQATGGVGLTLNVASLSIYMSNNFNYVHRKQSEDRNHRIGQTNKVLYIDILAENTIDNDIKTAINNKQNMADFVRNSLAKKR